MRVLVVDDEAEVRAAVRAMLAGAGYEVAEAGDGAEAVRTLRRSPADVVVCDLFMHGKDGLELIRELRGGFPGVKVIAMSGGGADGALDLLPLALQLGASGVLYKPFDQVVALAAINRALRPR
jgi:CheY-like chemotaxis protein